MTRLLITSCLAASLCVGAAPAPSQAASATPTELEALLLAGDLTDATRKLSHMAARDDADDNVRLACGLAQTLRGVERLMQSLHEYGLKPKHLMGMPVVRLPVPHNPDAKPLTNAHFRRIIKRFGEDLAEAEATLAAIESAEVRLPFHAGLVRMDFNQDGRASVDEALWKIFRRLGGPRIDQATGEGFYVVLDAGDVHWLRGYCHVLQAMCDMFLAYDTQELHDLTAHLFFPTAKIRHEFLRDHGGNVWWNDIRDVIAFFHLMRLPVVEPARMASAREHLLEMIAQSRLSWEAILAETDDDHEWVPNPDQKSVAAPILTITRPAVEQWGRVLDEAELILNGERLVPFWRGKTQQGINLRRVFEEPRTFDLVLWVQGSAAAPYLEEGHITSPAFWRETRQVFGGRLLWFSLWVN